VKRRDLERHLRENGCREVGGAKHAKWRGPEGHVSALPRHTLKGTGNEIGPGLAAAVCKQLGVPAPEGPR
jgi:hypothetical protein